MGVDLQLDKVDTQGTIKVDLHHDKVSMVDLQEEKVTVVDLYGRLRNNLMNPLAKLF